VRGARPLAIDDLVEVIGIADVCRVHGGSTVEREGGSRIYACWLRIASAGRLW
jgi:hypothetical protein